MVALGKSQLVTPIQSNHQRLKASRKGCFFYYNENQVFLLISEQSVRYTFIDNQL